MFPPGAEFLAKYVNDNIGPLGAVGRFPLGIAGSLAGVPGIGPGSKTVSGINKPAFLGGLAGGLIGGSFS